MFYCYTGTGTLYIAVSSCHCDINREQKLSAMLCDMRTASHKEQEQELTREVNMHTSIMVLAFYDANSTILLQPPSQAI